MEKKLEYYGGNGFGSVCVPGEYEIKYGENDSDQNSKEFTDFDEAKKFYDSLKCEKAFWDQTRIPELIDARVYVEDDSSNTATTKQNDMANRIVTVVDNSNYKSSYAEDVPFKAELIETVEEGFLYWVKSINTGKKYELYFHQIKEFKDGD